MACRARARAGLAGKGRRRRGGVCTVDTMCSSCLLCIGRCSILPNRVPRTYPTSFASERHIRVMHMSEVSMRTEWQVGGHARWASSRGDVPSGLSCQARVFQLGRAGYGASVPQIPRREASLSVSASCAETAAVPGRLRTRPGTTSAVRRRRAVHG
ncbi:hypothetical protein BD413DRAFT_203060 [Trametes elegans]|nr:hypothetical protein BD413DRAFT_203060 [Trametes elegans]